MKNEQTLKVTTYIKLDLIDRIKILFGRCLKIETKVIVPQEQEISHYNAVSNTTIESSIGVFIKQDRPPFGYTNIM
jgi:hypothetical protein